MALLPGNMLLRPGAFVRHPKETRLGLGRVQTIVGDTITVNFENAGKLVINGAAIELVAVDPKSLA